MTRHEIAAALFELLNKPPALKQDVVYALVEIRKILDHDGDRSADSVLRFYCDWALHTRLNRRGAEHILDILDERLGRYQPWNPESIDPDGIVHQILSFDLFQCHLFEFLRRNDLPTVWAEDLFAWQHTIIFYGRQVQHTPLTVTRNDYKFKYLQKVVISACEAAKEIVEANPSEHHFGFKWEFTLNDGNSFSLPHTSNLVEPPAGWKTMGVRSEEKRP